MILVIHIWISVWIIHHFTIQATEKYSVSGKSCTFCQMISVLIMLCILTAENTKVIVSTNGGEVCMKLKDVNNNSETHRQNSVTGISTPKNAKFKCVWMILGSCFIFKM